MNHGECIMNCQKELLWDRSAGEMLQIWGSCGTVMKWCSWIYQRRRARRFTPGQAPLLWRTACSAEPVRWVWCQTWVQCCSTCPAIPPGPQNKREDTKSHSCFCSGNFHKAVQGRRKDVTQMTRHAERKTVQSCAYITLKGFNVAWFLHVRF